MRCWAPLLLGAAVVLDTRGDRTAARAEAAVPAGLGLAVGETQGCTDSAADNYDSGAAVDSGECGYTCGSLAAKLGAPAETECLIYDPKAGQWPDSLGKGSSRTIASGKSFVVQGRPAKGWISGRAANESRPVWLPPLGFRLWVGENGGAQANLILRYANASHQSAPTGSAIYATSLSVLTVEGSWFEGNTASYDGGAIYAISSLCVLTVEGSWFKGNTAGQSGGAIYAGMSNLTVEGSWFEGNTASDGWGGAIRATDSTSVSVQGSWFEGNTAGDYGGAIRAESSSVSVEGSWFEGNTAGNHGGAISVESDGIADQFTVVLSGCSGCNNTDSDGKALEFGYLSTSRGVTHRSLTDADLRLPPSANGGTDAWAYISYTHPGARPLIAALFVMRGLRLTLNAVVRAAH